MSNNYELEGTGNKTLVFIHYFGGEAGSWKWMTKRMRKSHTCILLNLPGFGGVEPLKEPSIYGFAKYINNCIAELELTDYSICGHSMGAKLALYAAKITKGQKPKRIILMAPSPPTIENMKSEEKDRMLKHPDYHEARNTVNGATLKKLRKNRFHFAVRSQLRIDMKTWDWWLTEGMNNNIADRIEDVAVPISIIYSKDDPVIAEDAIQNEVLPYLENSSVIVLTKIGHLLPLEAPRKMARMLKKITR